MAARKLGASWWADFRFNGTRYRKKAPLNTKGGAQTYEVFLRGELAKHGSLQHLEPQPAPPKPATFAEFTERWMRQYVATMNKWSEQYSKGKILRAYLVPAFGSLSLADITPARIAALQAELASGRCSRPSRPLRPKTVNNILAVLRKCLAVAVEWGELQSLPVIRPMRVGPARFRYLRDEEVAAMLDAAPGSWRTMILVAAKTGLRYSELAGLRWEDVDLERRIVVVQRGKVLGRIDAPKNGRTRRVPITSDVADALGAFPTRSGPVFTHFETYRQAWRAIHETSQAAGLGAIGWHALRHTFASKLVSAGVPIRSVQELLGHQSITMTMRYSHLGPQELRAAIEVLEPGEMGNWRSRNTPDEQVATRVAPPTTPNHRLEAVVGHGCGGGI